MNPLTPLELLDIIEREHGFESPSIRLALECAKKVEELYKRLFNVCKEYKHTSIGFSDDSEFLNVMSELEEELK